MTIPSLLPVAGNVYRIVLIACLAGSLVGCVSNHRTHPVETIAIPLAGINIAQAEIPPLLHTAFGNPYALTADTGCKALSQEIIDLDTILGRDIKMGANALTSPSENVILFRDWGRQQRSTTHRSEKVQAVIKAGNLRRAFLQGMLVGQGCSNLTS